MTWRSFRNRSTERIVENAQIFDFNLDAAGFVALDALDRTDGTPLAR